MVRKLAWKEKVALSADGVAGHSPIVEENEPGCFPGSAWRSLDSVPNMVGHQAAFSDSANASHSKPSGRFFDGVMIQETSEWQKFRRELK
jgi:hypothetical protein